MLRAPDSIGGDVQGGGDPAFIVDTSCSRTTLFAGLLSQHPVFATAAITDGGTQCTSTTSTASLWHAHQPADPSSVERSWQYANRAPELLKVRAS